MTYVERYDIMDLTEHQIKQLECEIQWIKNEMATKKLSQKNIAEYERQIIQKELFIAFGER